MLLDITLLPLLKSAMLPMPPCRGGMDGGTLLAMPLDSTLLVMLKLEATLVTLLKLEVGSCRRRGGLGAVSRRVVWPSVRRSTGNSPCALLQLDTLLEVDIALMVSLAATNLLDTMP